MFLLTKLDNNWAWPICPKSHRKIKYIENCALNIYMENTQLSIADLASLKNIIDAACIRGAFKAQEMKAIGEVYEKLSAFLDAVVAQHKAQEETAEVDQAQQPQGDENA